MLPFAIFLVVVAIVWGFMLYNNGYAEADDRARKRERECDNQWRRATVERWGWLLKANARRKRFERALRRERVKHELVQRNMIVRHGQVLAELEQAHEELDLAEQRYRELAARTAECLLEHEEQQILSLFQKHFGHQPKENT